MQGAARRSEPWAAASAWERRARFSPIALCATRSTPAGADGGTMSSAEKGDDAMKARGSVTRAAVAFLLAAACFVPVVVGAADDPLAASLRAVVEGNIAAYNSKDVAGTMSFVDTKSPD